MLLAKSFTNHITLLIYFFQSQNRVALGQVNISKFMGIISFFHLLKAEQIKKADLDHIFELANKYQTTNREDVLRDSGLHSKVLATLFFESSTRTRFSFEAAMARLGGKVITLEQGQASSASKGETMSDLGIIVGGYADAIVIRHPQIGSVAEAAKFAKVPVINAGDGAGEHPTQALVDLYTIFTEKKRLNNLKIGILGDLKYGRTTNSLLSLFGEYKDNHFTLISDQFLSLTTERRERLNSYNYQFTETDNLENAIKDLDVLYVTRVQKERFESLSEYDRVKNLYRVNKKALLHAKSNLIIMHPLPRVSEIDPEIDFLPSAKYFKQAENSLYVRMALLTLMLK